MPGASLQSAADAMGARTAAGLFATTVKTFKLHRSSCEASRCVSALQTIQQRAFHAPQQQVQHGIISKEIALLLTGLFLKQDWIDSSSLVLQSTLSPGFAGHASCASSPRYMVSLLPGRCRGAAVEVEGAADTHEFRSITEQGTLSADPTDFFRTAKDSSRLCTVKCLDSVPRECTLCRSKAHTY